MTSGRSDAAYGAGDARRRVGDQDDPRAPRSVPRRGRRPSRSCGPPGRQRPPAVVVKVGCVVRGDRSRTRGSAPAAQVEG
jgi:hypothetical protein